MKMLKTLSVVSSVLFVALAQAQFTLVAEHPTRIVQLQSLGSGARFIGPMSSNNCAGGSRIIYNLDLSVHRVLNYPAPPAGMCWTTMGYITEELFDTDPSTIEFTMVAMPAGGPGNNAAFVYRENGTELFAQNPGNFAGGAGSFLQSFEPIFTVAGATYMVVHSTFIDGPPVRIYTLPGALPCMDCFGSPTSGIGLGGEHIADPYLDILIYPNPSHTNATVVLDDHITDAMEVYNGAGQLVRTIATAAARQVEVDTSSLPAGNYTVVVLNAGRRLATLPLVIAR